MRISFFIFLFYISTTTAQSDLHFTKYYSQKDGLSNTAGLLHLDSRGFLWVASREGLNRFDGLHFKTYYHNKNIPNGLPHNSVLSILEYQPGLLLLATPNGLTVLNSITGQFEPERITSDPYVNESNSQFMSTHIDPEGNVWINRNGEFDVFDNNLKYLYRFTDLTWTNPLKGALVAYEEDWFYDKTGNLWLATDTSGIQIVDFKNKKIYNRNNNAENLHYLEYKHIRAFYLDTIGEVLWVCPWGDGLYQFHLKTGEVNHTMFGHPSNTEPGSINTLFSLENGHILCSSFGIFYELNPITMEYIRIETPLTLNASNHKNYIQALSIIKTPHHGYWVGAEEGLFKLEEGKREHELKLDPFSSSAAPVDLLISGNKFIYHIYVENLLVETTQDRLSFNKYKVPVSGDKPQLTRLCEDQDNQLWIGTKNGVLLFDLLSKHFKAAPSSMMQLNNQFINVLFCDSDGEIWIGTREPFFLYRYDPHTNSLVKIENEFVNQFRIGTSGRISSISEDAKGMLWMRSAIGGGLLKYDKRNDTWKNYLVDSGSTLQSNKGIYSHYADQYGAIWLSTVTGDGLIQFSYEKDQIRQFNREDGILSDYILEIMADDKFLWLTSAYGVSQFNIYDHSVISYNWSGIGPVFKTVIDTFRDELVISTANKQVFFSTRAEGYSLPKPVPIIDAINVNHQEQSIHPQKTKLRLNHNQKNITIQFTSPYYTDADKLRFAYMLEGADQEWQFPVGTRTAQYAALASGNYVFKIKAADPAGKWGDSIDALAFTIVPPFWKTSWFLISLATSIALLLFLILKKRVATIRYESGLKQKIAETEMMALRAQLNPHFIFNCINSIDSLIQSNDKYNATIYLNKFAKLIRNILDSSKQNTVPLTKDLETLKYYIELEQFRNENKFTYEFSTDPSLLEDDYKVPPLIVQPYVENAILHGIRNRTDSEGRLFISLTRQNGHIQYIIEDNGVGREESMTTNSEKSSYGMKMSSERVKLFNQEDNASVEITDLKENGMPAGTRVEVKLKVQ